MTGIGTHSVARKAVYDAYMAEQSNWLIPEVTMIASPLPLRYGAEQVIERPLVHIVTLGFDETRLSRSPIATREVVVQTIIMQKLVTDDTGDFDLDRVDLLLDFKEQLADINKRVTFYSHTWVRSYELRDAQGLPYSYDLVRESNFVQAYINAAFSGGKQ